MSPHHHDDVLFWIASMQVVPEDFPADTSYSYCVVDHDSRRVLRKESGAPRQIQLPAIQLDDNARIDVYDLWQDASCPESFIFRSAFKDVIFNHWRPDQLSCTEQQVFAPANGTDTRDGIFVHFKICCPRLQSGQAVCLVGDVTHGSLLRYVLSDESTSVSEVGSERELVLATAGKPHPAAIFVDDGYFKASPWRGAGLAVPVFSLRSEEDVGVGEFSDLKMLVDVAVKAGLHLIQLLPVNDTSVNGMWWDSYPYSSLSVFALHPLYLRLQCLSTRLPHDIQEEIQCEKKKLDQKVRKATSLSLDIGRMVSPGFFSLFRDNMADKGKDKLPVEESSSSTRRHRRETAAADTQFMASARTARAPRPSMTAEEQEENDLFTAQLMSMMDTFEQLAKNPRM
ncbi:hypothetical protein L7F22_035735 [Adiantum nelumboides]|nr:hypothetical protein [Adiantum nelumboides]